MMNRNEHLIRQNRGHETWFSLRDEMRDLLSRFTEDWALPTDIARKTNQFVPHIDVCDVGDYYLVTAEVPGILEKDLDVSFDKNTLTIQGEKRNEVENQSKDFWQSEISYGSFYRCIPLVGSVDDKKVEASFTNGVLQIKLWKREESESLPQKIEIKWDHQIQ